MIGDAIAAKVQQLREQYEREGFQVIERPGPEEFPFEVGYFGHYRPAMLARRGDENIVLEVRDPYRLSIERLTERMEEIRGHKGWRFFLVSVDDVVPHDAPGLQGDPPAWPYLETVAEEALRISASGPDRIALLAVFSALEGVLRKTAVTEGIPVDRLPAPLLITALYDQGLVPFEAYQPLNAALKVHRRVLHGYDAPAEEIGAAVQVVAECVRELLPQPVEYAA
jgi:hypothetical protein